MTVWLTIDGDDLWGVAGILVWGATPVEGPDMAWVPLAKSLEGALLSTDAQEGSGGFILDPIQRGDATTVFEYLWVVERTADVNDAGTGNGVHLQWVRTDGTVYDSGSVFDASPNPSFDTTVTHGKAMAGVPGPPPREWFSRSPRSRSRSASSGQRGPLPGVRRRSMARAALSTWSPRRGGMLGRSRRADTTPAQRPSGVQIGAAAQQIPSAAS